jgi:hypothetical protein
MKVKFAHYVVYQILTPSATIVASGAGTLRALEV